MRSRRPMFWVVVAGVATTICPLTRALPSGIANSVAPSDVAGEIRGYLTATGLLNRGLYESAAEEYTLFLDAHPSHEKAPLARYGLGVCCFRRDLLDEAVAALAPLVPRLDFEFAAEVSMMLGQAHLALGRYPDAQAAFKAVTQRDEDHALAADAAAGLVEVCYRLRKGKVVLARCRDFVRRWPVSPLRERIELFWALESMAQGDHESAATRLTSMIEAVPGSALCAQFSVLLGQCRRQSGALDEADSLYEKVLKGPTRELHPDALLGLGQNALHRGDARAAGELLDRLLEHHPTSRLARTARLHRARAWYEMGELEKARAMFARLAKAGGELSDEAAYWLGKCSLRAGDYERAAAELQAAREAHSESRLLVEMQYDQAVALLRSSHYEEAIEALTVLLDEFPRHVNAADALHLIAVAQHQLGKYGDSLGAARRFLSRHPQHELATETAFLEAENLYLTGRYSDAIDAYRAYKKRSIPANRSARATFRLGMALYRVDEIDEAERHLTTVVGGASSDKSYSPAHLALGDIQFRREQWAAAEDQLQRYLSSSPDGSSAADAMFKLALAQERQGKRVEAVDSLDRFLARFDDSPHRSHAMFERGQALVALDKLNEAVAQFERLLAEDGEGRFAAFSIQHLGAIAMKRGDFESASNLYGRIVTDGARSGDGQEAAYNHAQALLAAGDFDKALVVLNTFVADKPGKRFAARAEAARVIVLSRLDRCADALKAAQAMATRHGDLGTQQRRAVLYERAWCEEKLEQHEPARQSYRRLVDGGLDDEYGRHAALDLAVIEAEAQQHERAAVLLRQLSAVLAGSGSPVASELREQSTYRLAVAEFELKRFEEARKLLEAFIDGFPNSELLASANYLCGESLFLSGKHATAVAYLTRVTQEYPSNAVTPAALLRLGESLAALQRWSESERAFIDFLDRFPTDKLWFQARFGVGWARENLGRHDEAMSAYRDVVERHQGPTAARAQFQIGECLFAKRRYGDATRELLKVDILYAYPEWSAAALYEAGRCFERLGKPVEARAQFNAVFERHSKSHWAALAAKKLSELSVALLPGK